MKRVVVLIVCLLCCLSALAVTQPKSVLFDTHSVVIDLAESNTYTVSGRVFPDDASQQLNWYSSNTKLFTVQGGVITALRIGTGELRANVPGITAIGDKYDRVLSTVLKHVCWEIYILLNIRFIQ